MNVIETRDIVKRFGKVDIVKGINLKVEEGEVFGFLGRNGAGKSTFINILTGILRPTSGSFSILGEKAPNEEVKKRIGVLPDYTAFYHHMNAIAHLKYFANISGKKVTTAECLRVLKWVGLGLDLNKRVSKFSFGMKKKLGLAQAIIHDPELLFLDEPTSGLDVESAIEIQQLIIKLKEMGKTIFLTSHNLYEVEKLCNRIGIMKDGKLQKLGTIAELKAYYRSKLIVTMKHSIFPQDQEHTVIQWLNNMSEEIQREGEKTIITLEKEEQIAQIVRAFNQYKIDIFRIEVDEPSLEEVFLEG